ncbi:MAG: TMEM165/GDT1 family protein [Clostridia bacterium]|nr:TMEM165/GDT1 family protein [Clostridia bacterium]
MEWFYPFLITFTLVFFSELGDKTQLLVLSFSTKNRIKYILLGVAIGTFLSHGFAILFGSNVAYFSSDSFQFYLKVFTYTSFVLFGIWGFLPKNVCSNPSKASNNHKLSHKSNFLQKFCSLKLNCVFMVAFCILVGEIGDKTFLASLSLGFEYPHSKFPLILGSVCGMVLSNLIAIVCGRLIGTHLKQGFIDVVSNISFIVFGILGFLHVIF